MGTNDAYMGINGHICIQNVPPLLAGGFRGAKPPKLPFSAPYKHKRSDGMMAVCSNGSSRRIDGPYYQLQSNKHRN